MKVLVVLSALVAIAAANALTPGELQLLEAYDYDALFAKDDQRKAMFDCLLEKGECGSYKQIADLSVKVIKYKCAECSPAQKTKYEHVLKQLHDNYEPVYNELLKKLAATKK